MNIIGHIPGVTNTGIFSPGNATPAPYNVAHTGAVDGAGPASASKNMAEIYNRLLLERAAVIQELGEAIDNDNWVQLAVLLKSRIDTLNAAIASIETAGADETANRTSADSAIIAALYSGAGRKSWAKRTTGGTVPATETLLSFNQSAGPLLSGGVFTIPTSVAFPAGSIYQVSACVSVVASSNGAGNFFVYLKKNGVTIGGYQYGAASYNGFGAATVHTSTIEIASASDTFSASTSLNGGALEFLSGATMTVERVG